jgi:MOSC domain-containing protein YiiM
MPITVASINISDGGIPKSPLARAHVTSSGISGDAHNHEKHNTPMQALCLFDLAGLSELRAEGYELVPGSLGENITLDGIDVDTLEIGDRLRFSGGVEVEVTKRRSPCYVLDAIDESLKTALVGRIGVYARVITTGMVNSGEEVRVIRREMAHA